MKKIAILGCILTMLTACQPSDPSAKDLKSPCVSNDKSDQSPCARRVPVAQFLLV